MAIIETSTKKSDFDTTTISEIIVNVICTGQNRFSGIFYIDAYNHLHNLSHFSAKYSYDDSLCDYTNLYSFLY